MCFRKSRQRSPLRSILLTRSAGIFAAHAAVHGLESDAEIKHQAPMLHVVQVPACALANRSIAAAATAPRFD